MLGPGSTLEDAHTLVHAFRQLAGEKAGPGNTGRESGWSATAEGVCCSSSGGLTTGERSLTTGESGLTAGESSLGSCVDACAAGGLTTGESSLGSSGGLTTGEISLGSSGGLTTGESGLGSSGGLTTGEISLGSCVNACAAGGSSSSSPLKQSIGQLDMRLSPRDALFADTCRYANTCRYAVCKQGLPFKTDDLPRCQDPSLQSAPWQIAAPRASLAALF